MPASAAPPAQRRPVSRRTKTVLAVLAALLALPLLAIAILLTFDWNRARPWLNARVSEAIARPFAIEGELAVDWQQPARAMTSGERGWRDYVPWPHLVANDVHIGNPPGMTARDMASVRQFSFSLNPFALLGRSISIPVLRFDAPRVALLRTGPGHNNWTFRRADKRSAWSLDLRRVVLSGGVLTLDDSVTDAHLTARVDTLRGDPTYGIGWTVKGSYNGAPVGGGGKAGTVLSLTNQGAPFPIQAEMHSGATRVALGGTVTRPARLAGLDLRLELAAPSMARLYNFTGLTLPETPAFSTEGRLRGAIEADGSRWRYDDFTGKVGASDIAGKLDYRSGTPRGVLSGTVRSHQLLFSDLAPLIGADSNASKAARGVDAVQPAGKALPVEKFRTERWKSIDADVRFAADRIVRKRELPVTRLSTHLVLKDGVLTLDPLTFGLAGGTLTSTIRLDGSDGGRAIKASASVAARKVQIKQLFPAIEKVRQATVGQINGDARLSAVGDSVASLLAHADGELKALVNQGTVSKLLLEEMGLNVGNIIVTKLFGDKQVQLNCLASDFKVASGVARTRMFVVDTEEAVITADGAIDLASERMDLTLRPETKGLRLFSLRAPIYVRGTFKDPEVAVDKRVLAMKAGGAAVLGAVAAPLAAMLPLINAGPGEDSDCARLLARARQKPSAPPPGRARR